jgi:hypothetical protein
MQPVDTRTSTIREILGNGHRFRVPTYQRDYAWRAEQWEDLWNDVLALRADPTRRHYLGALVVESPARPGDPWLIIDGQQRLTTLSLLVLGAIRQLRALAATGVHPEANLDRAAGLRASFIADKDLATLVATAKLRLNERDDPAWLLYAVPEVEPPSRRRLPASSQALLDGIDWFAERFAADPTLADHGEAIAGLVQSAVVEHVYALEIRVGPDADVFALFETLNARGTALNVTDLLKNHVLGRAGEAIDVARPLWRRVVDTVGYEEFPGFLRQHLLLEVDRLALRRLFAVVRARAAAPADVIALLRALDARAELYAALHDAHHPLWSEPDLRAAAPWLADLRAFGLGPCVPLLFAVFERLADRVEAVAHLLSVITFRHTVVGQRNPNAVEVACQRAGREVLAGRVTDMQGLRAALSDVMVPDDTFVADFRRFAPDARLAKRVLCRLEADARGAPVDPESDPATIEHILPQNAGDAWADAVAPERQARCVGLVGNLALLGRSANRRLGNAGWAEKRSAYAESGYLTTAELGSLEAWDEGAIGRRQAGMAKRAGHVWGAP